MLSSDRSARIECTLLSFRLSTRWSNDSGMSPQLDAGLYFLQQNDRVGSQDQCLRCCDFSSVGEVLVCKEKVSCQHEATCPRHVMSHRVCITCVPLPQGRGKASVRKKFCCPENQDCHCYVWSDVVTGQQSWMWSSS